MDRITKTKNESHNAKKDAMQQELAELIRKISTKNRELNAFFNESALNRYVLKDGSGAKEPLFVVGDAISKSAFGEIRKKEMFYVTREDAHPPIA
jgi:hypothetical protein